MFWSIVLIVIASLSLFGLLLNRFDHKKQQKLDEANERVQQEKNQIDLEALMKPHITQVDGSYIVTCASCGVSHVVTDCENIPDVIYEIQMHRWCILNKKPYCPICHREYIEFTKAERQKHYELLNKTTTKEF